MDLRPHCWQGTELGAKFESTLIQFLWLQTLAPRLSLSFYQQIFLSTNNYVAFFGKGNSRGPGPCGVYSLARDTDYKKEKTAWICAIYMIHVTKETSRMQWQMWEGGFCLNSQGGPLWGGDVEAGEERSEERDPTARTSTACSAAWQKWVLSDFRKLRETGEVARQSMREGGIRWGRQARVRPIMTTVRNWLSSKSLDNFRPRSSCSNFK